MKVLAVIDHLNGGGAERQFLALCLGLHKRGHSVRVVLTEGGGLLYEQALDDGLDVVSQSKDVKRSTFSALRVLRRNIDNFSPDVVMAWLSYSIALTAFILRRDRFTRFICSERSSLEMLFNEEVRFGGIKKFILKRAMKHASHVVTNARAVAEEYVDEGYCSKDQIQVIYNGLDIEGLTALPSKRELRVRYGLYKEVLYGVFAGKLEKRKGIAFLLEAMGALSDSGMKMLVLGNGSLEETVRGNGAVELIGFRDDVKEYIKAADFLALPSLYEGLPNVVLEAMAVGTPVIATKVSGLPEIIEDGISGILVNPGDADALAKAMKAVASDGDLRDSLALRAKESIKRFSFDRMVDEFEHLLQSTATVVK